MNNRPAGGTIFLAQLLAGSAVIHLVKPGVFEPMVPEPFPPSETVLVSGVAELICAVGLLVPRTRRVSGWASTALLLAVFPANVKMAVEAQRSASPFRRYGALARLPLQLPLLRLAWKAARGQG